MAFLAGIITFGFTALLTIAGVGAAFILIPVFLALGIEVHTAMATALLLNAVGMSVASVNFIRRKLVVWRVAVPILIVAVVLAPLGVVVSRGLDRTVLLWLFVAFLVFAAAMMLFYTPRARETTVGKGGLLGIGMGVGGAAGFLGHASLAGMNYPLLGWTALGSAGGAALGSRLMSDRLKGRQVKLLIGLVLIAIALKMAWGLL